MKINFFFLFFFLCFLSQARDYQKVTFPSLDGLTVFANAYQVDDAAPTIILCHQALYNKLEYKETALKLNELGFNCLAIDQRSGGKLRGENNETCRLAKQKKLSTNYIDAEQDIIAAVNYIYNQSKKKVILLGSSYSASLVLKIASENEKVKAVISFSPGEYFKNLSIKETVGKLNKPAWLSSSKQEGKKVKTIFQAIKGSQKTQFIPKSSGYHGSKALWSSSKGNKEYWDNLTKFLLKIK